MNLKAKISFLSLLFIGVYFFLTAFVNQTEILDSSRKVADVLNKLGDKPALHFIASSQLDSAKVNAGYKLVTTGFMTPNSKRQSKHFVCTDCHNIEREDPDLTQSNPETRMEYVAENGLKFLPATTLYGTVNKKHWYNGDYYQKYGELVDPARDTLENAIQLCAVVCSQGRALEKDEMDAVMHYFNSIGYTLNDLNLTDKELTYISQSIPEKALDDDKNDAMDIIESKYLEYSPATFMKPMAIEKRNLGKKNPRGSLERGKKIYDLSCMTCHKQGGVTNYKLSNEQLTHKHLKYWAGTNKVFSVYNITRKGTYSKNGYKPYMPNYTKERLSDQQLEDLMSYINAMADNGTISKKYRTISTPSF